MAVVAKKRNRRRLLLIALLGISEFLGHCFSFSKLLCKGQENLSQGWFGGNESEWLQEIRLKRVSESHVSKLLYPRLARLLRWTTLRSSLRVCDPHSSGMLLKIKWLDRLCSITKVGNFRENWIHWIMLNKEVQVTGGMPWAVFSHYSLASHWSKNIFRQRWIASCSLVVGVTHVFCRL